MATIPTMMAMTVAYDAVLFDLDGTLIDSAPDLANSVNVLLEQYQRPHCDEAVLCQAVSFGAAEMLKLGFQGDYPISFSLLHQAYLAHYCENNTVYTRFFDGIALLLQTIERAGVPWAVVTNKATAAAERIISHFAIDKHAGAVVCGDTLAVSKPDAAPLLLACETMQVTPSRCVYVGDALTDIEAGKNAGMETIACRYGYIPNGVNVEDWGADAIAEHPRDILSAIIRL